MGILAQAEVLTPYFIPLAGTTLMVMALILDQLPWDNRKVNFHFTLFPDFFQVAMLRKRKVEVILY